MSDERRKELRQKILRLLEQNARMPSTEIADRLALPVDRVEELIREMESDRTILGYYALVNEDAPEDGGVRAIIEVEVQPEREGGFDRIARMITRFSEVRTAYLVSGRYDLLLEVVGPSIREVAFFVARRLAPIDGVKSTVTHFLLKKYKEAGFDLTEEEPNERLKISP